MNGWEIVGEFEEKFNFEPTKYEIELKKRNKNYKFGFYAEKSPFLALYECNQLISNTIKTEKILIDCIERCNIIYENDKKIKSDSLFDLYCTSFGKTQPIRIKFGNQSIIYEPKDGRHLVYTSLQEVVSPVECKGQLFKKGVDCRMDLVIKTEEPVKLRLTLPLGTNDVQIKGNGKMMNESFYLSKEVSKFEMISLSFQSSKVSFVASLDWRIDGRTISLPLKSVECGTRESKAACKKVVSNHHQIRIF